ncbi:MAG: M17 family peptidase N-terminal domain-containing protein, partial [Rhodothermales bacterium]
MKVSITTLPLLELDVDLLLVPVFEENAADRLKGLADDVDESVGRAADDFTGSTEDGVVIYPTKAKAKRIGLVGAGSIAKSDAEQLRRAMATGADLAKKCKANTIGIVQPAVELDPEVVGHALVEGFMLASYRFTRYKTDDKGYPGAERLVIHVGQQESASRRGVERGRIVAEAVMTARDLVNTSPDDKTATAFSRSVEKLGKKCG